jgi:hypothetical protein
MAKQGMLVRHFQFRLAPFLLTMCCAGVLLALLAKPAVERLDEQERHEAARRRQERLAAEEREANRRAEEARIARMTETLASLKRDLEAAAAGNLEEEPDSNRRKVIPFDGRPHGCVVFVSRREGTVNIDIGRRQHLRLNVRFRIFERTSFESPDTSRVVGEIAVSRFIGDNIAEARLLSEEPPGSVRQGDVVWSSEWSPQPETFAVVGEFDINDDGNDDTELVRDLIRQNGGHIHAEVETTTDYIVVSRSLIEHTVDDGQALDRLARAAGARLLVLNEPTRPTAPIDIIGLLDSIGPKQSDARRREPGGTSTPKRTSLNPKRFRERRPSPGR